MTANYVPLAVLDDAIAQAVEVAVEAERTRIERNLHDIAQQKLVAVALRLKLLARRAAPECGAFAFELDESVEQLAGVAAGLRGIATALRPPGLDEDGLERAIREVAACSPLEVRVRYGGPTRVGEEADAAIYHLVCEALTNAAKHSGAARIEVSVATREGVAVVEVRDDGAGGAELGKGTGLRGIERRFASLGGSFEVVDVLGGGTLLHAALPVECAGAAA